MVHRLGTDTRLLSACLKSEKEYIASLKAFLSHSQSSLTALQAYASSCPPAQATAMLNVITALMGIDDAWGVYLESLDTWRDELKTVRKAEEVVGTVLRDREILVNKLIKVSNKRSTRDSVQSTSQANQFISDPSLTPFNAANTSTTTLTTSAKLNHAQAELQACEAHLAEKEKELEEIRETAIRRGLEKRCKALVSCGWSWGERGKQALRALEGLGTKTAADTSKSPYPQLENNDSQLSSVTPSQSASQIALAVTSDDSPARSSSLAHRPSSPTPRRSSSTNVNTSSPLHTRPVIASGPEQMQEEPNFKLNIGPAHSIGDQNYIHDSIPSSSVIPAKKSRLVDSSDEELAKAPLEVHENRPFKQTSPTKGLSQKPPSVTGGKEGRGTLKRPHPQRRDSKQDKSKIGFPSMGSHKQKHSSDLGPRTYPAAPNYSTKDEYSPQGYKPDQSSTLRKRSTSISLLNGFTGLFRKRSSSAERGYPMSTGGWHTRVDKNLSSIRRGRAGSSSEDELPSTLARKAKHLNQDSDTEDHKKLSKRLSNTVTRHKKPEESEGSKYIVVERGEKPSGLTRTASHSSRRSENISSTEIARETARETAANTAINSGTPNAKRQSLPAEPFSFPRRDGESFMNRLQGDINENDLSTSAQRNSELSKLSERLKRLEDMGRDVEGGREREREPISPLGPGKLEVVKAPPSITQVPLLFHPTPSTLYGESQSARSSTFKENTETKEGRGHRRMSSLSGAGTGMNPPLSLNATNGGGANLKARPSSASSRDGVPLKPALKSPTTKGASSLPALPSILVKKDGPSPSPTNERQNQSFQQQQERTLQAPERTASPPTPLGAKDGLLVNGDSIFVPAFIPSGLRSPPTTASSLVPSPRRLSEIPGSNRTSMIFDPVATGGDDESVYETPDEELSGEETEDTIEGRDALVMVENPALSSTNTDTTIRSPQLERIEETPARARVGNGTPPIPIPSNGNEKGKYVALSPNEPAALKRVQESSGDKPRDSMEIESGREDSQNASTASHSTASASGNTRRKSVRMLIYPTVAVSPPDRYDDEPRTRSRSPTHRNGDKDSPPLTPASGSTIRASSGNKSGTSSARSSGFSTGPVPGAWETRINTTSNAWDNSSEEDEEYKSARRALSRASEPYEGGRNRRA